VLLGGALSLAFGAAELWAAFSLAGVLAAVSIADDMRGLPPGRAFWRMPSPPARSSGMLLSPMDLVPMAVLIVAVVWITNLFNFMDGSDGLAGGMRSSASAHSAPRRGWRASAASRRLPGPRRRLGRVPPAQLSSARIFLGDVGAVPLGFLAAGLGLIGWRDDLCRSASSPWCSRCSSATRP
jgi:UDP-N-acetylmuramyl pentapeptide phosphotransferase/UDP-N-acetylglucosamine-1-phosphate transferase